MWYDKHYDRTEVSTDCYGERENGHLNKKGIHEDVMFEENFFYSFLEDFIYLFLERGEGREKERERNINVWLPVTHPLLGTWPTTQACAVTGS